MKRLQTAGQMRAEAGVPEVILPPDPAPVREHTHVYPWSEVKAALDGGPRPKCRLCGEEDESVQ